MGDDVVSLRSFFCDEIAARTIRLALTPFPVLGCKTSRFQGLIRLVGVY